MFIDLHMHECTYSKDSFLKLEEIVELAKKRGLGAVCITDHESAGGNLFQRPSISEQQPRVGGELEDRSWAGRS